MKKRFIALFALTICGAFTACGVDEPAEEVDDNTVEVTSELIEEETEAEESTTEAEEETEVEIETEYETESEQEEAGTEAETEFIEEATEEAGIIEEDGLYYVPAESSVFSGINTPESPWQLSVGVDSKSAAESLTVRESGYANVMKNDSILGTIIELDSSANDEITRVVIKFEVADEYTENVLNMYPDEPELQGIKRLNVFKWIEDMNMSLPIETKFDGNTVYTEVDELGTYDLTDMEIWLYNMGIEIPEENGE